MSAFNYSLGRNSKIVLLDPDGAVVDTQYVKDFDTKQEKHDVTVKGMDGNKFVFYAQDGWGGSFTTTRRNANLDAFFEKMESDWRDNGDANLCSFYLYETEQDGSQTVHQYSNVTVHLSDGGKRDVDDKAVEYKVEFWASRRTSQ